MSRRRIATLTVTASLALTGAFSTSAQASFHENAISEVHQGVLNVGDYIELQAYAPGQNLLATHYVRMYDGGNAQMSIYQIPTNVSNGANQATVLIANDGTVPGADFNAAGNLQVVNANGAACFLDTLTIGVDCVDWGSSVGGALPSPVGTPLALAAGTIPDNGSIQRNITPNCTTALDKADDTDNSNVDFALGAPSPRGNAATPTEIVCDTSPCKGQTPTIGGTPGNDAISGTAGKDVISAGAGNDAVQGLNGKDVICGEEGKDKINGGNAKDALLGGPGKDSMNGGNGKDSLIGQGGNDTCKGGKGEDTAKKCEVEKGI